MWNYTKEEKEVPGPSSQIPVESTIEPRKTTENKKKIWTALDSDSTGFCLRSGSPDEDSWESGSDLGSGEVGSGREAPWREILVPSYRGALKTGSGPGARELAYAYLPLTSHRGWGTLGGELGGLLSFRCFLLSLPAGKAGYSCLGAAFPQRWRCWLLEADAHQCAHKWPHVLMRRSGSLTASDLYCGGSGLRGINCQINYVGNNCWNTSEKEEIPWSQKHLFGSRYYKCYRDRPAPVHCHLRLGKPPYSWDSV